jgi:hypothetical protein
MDFPSRIYIVSLNVDFSKHIDKAVFPLGAHGNMAAI